MKQALTILFTTIANVMAEGANAIAPPPSSVNKDKGWGNQFERIAVEESVSCGGADDYGDDDVCPEGEFCHRETGSCDDGPWGGVCMPRPELCTMDYDPVCGCDGEVYSNLCTAHSEGMSVSYLGECEPQFERMVVASEAGTAGVTTPCGTGITCSTDEYCERDTGSCDGAGVCKPRPEVCTMDYTPVCGCDEKIYGNLCGAYAHGMSVSYLGECGSNKQWWFGSFSLNLSPVQATRDESSGRNDGFPGAILCFIYLLSSLAFTWNF